MTLFNADGSEAEISGNGIRCLAQAARLAGHAGDVVAVATAGGVRRLVCRHSDGDTAQIEVAMGPVSAGPPMADAGDLARPGFMVLEAATGDVGNPHVVLLVDDLGAVDVSIDGPAIESHWKPDGINVHFVVVAGAHTLAVKHWERGVGVTEACGSGATVAATIAHRWGLVGPEVLVNMPGGAATVHVADDALLVGPATYIGRIEVH